MEAFGLAALEAMACGVPPVATWTGGVPELVQDSVDGFLEPIGDIEAQAYRLVSLLTDQRLHETISQAARQTALKRFCTDLIIPQYEAHYGRVLQG
jgi:glycosyltransferase involved in cell wall biosynthesis